jgi:hypothetical protein
MSKASEEKDDSGFTTDKPSECKGCSANVRISPEEIAVLFNHTMKLKEIKLVSEEEYAVRIEKCQACSALQYGTTCKHCGCLVYIKAKLKGAKCPYPFSPKW